MSYVLVSAEQLNHIAKKLINTIGHNEKKTAFCLLLVRLTKKDLEAARGLLILGIEEKVPSLFFVLQQLNIPDSSFEDNQRLIELNKLLNYFNAYFQEDYSNDRYFWNKNLKEIIESNLTAIVNRDYKISEFNFSTPNLLVLRKYIKELPEKYEEVEKKRDFKNPDRHSLVNFISFTHKHSLSERIVKNKENEIDIRLALLLFVSMYIEEQYWVGSASGGMFNTGSFLFQNCLEFLNIKELSDISFREKVRLLEALSDFIERAESFIFLSKEIETFKSKIQEFLIDLKLQIHKNATLDAVSKKTAESVTQAAPYVGRGILCSQVATTFLSYGMNGFVVIPATIILFIYSNKASSQLYKAMVSPKSNELSKTMTSLYSGLLKKIGKKVGEATEGFARITLSANIDGYQKLRAYIKPEDEKIFIEWVNTLLQLPNTIVTEKEKSCIRTVLGLLPEQEMVFEPEQSARLLSSSTIMECK